MEPKDIQRYERELRAMLLRAGDEDPEGFAAIHQLLNQAVGQLPAAAELTRLQHGYSWTELAHGMGVSRQALHQLVARKALPIDPEASTETRISLLRARIRQLVKCTHEQRSADLAGTV